MSIQIRSVGKSFGKPPNPVLKDIQVEIQDEDFFAITGRSGSGKSTLLYIVSSLDEPSEGEVLIEGLNIHRMDSKSIHEFRNSKMGFVFQFHYLLPELSAIENVLMPSVKSRRLQERKDYAHFLMKEFGLDHRLHHKPTELSGGEQQRVAIARALVMEPRHLFADEPTGNLDSTNGDIVMRILKRFNFEKKMTVIYVTHDEGYARMGNRRIHLVDGKIENSQ